MAFATVTDIKNLIQIPENANDADLTNRIREAETFDIRNQIGKEFFDDLVANQLAGENPALIEELKPSICYYAFARHLVDGSSKPTSYGYKKKETPHSSNVEKPEREADAAKYRSMAFEYFEKAIDFIKTNISDYPNFKGRTNFKKMGVNIAIITNT